MICDGRGCSVLAHLNCYFSKGSKDANDTISDIEHWHCENCGGLPRHMHPRPRAAKRARVSFDPLLPTPMATTSAQAVSTTHPSGGWGGHWPIRTAMPPTAKGKGKEAMEPGKEAMDKKPMDHDMISCSDSALPTLPPTDAMLVDQDPEHRSTSLPLGPPRKSSRGPKTSKSHKWAKSGHGGHQREDFKGLGWQSRERHRRHQPDPPL